MGNFFSILAFLIIIMVFLFSLKLWYGVAFDSTYWKIYADLESDITSSNRSSMIRSLMHFNLEEGMLEQEVYEKLGPADDIKLILPEKESFISYINDYSSGLYEAKEVLLRSDTHSPFKEVNFTVDLKQACVLILHFNVNKRLIKKEYFCA
ncbi:MAG: hypothetical protein MK052_11930 [Alphaproteobacteria bacterium]|nr:hypothetical protein [Alphaproteobacteria bacterium]